jgi:hypothetical protein
MEIINNGQITPHRLHALVRLVSRLDDPTKEDLLNLLQPPGLIDNQDAAEAVYGAARRHNLIFEQADGNKKVTLHPDLSSSAEVESVEGFRAYVRQQLLGIDDDGKDNYLLNLFTAWYAVQNEWVIQHTKRETIVRFNAELYPQEETDDQGQGRAFNNVKFNAWLPWAAFLGFGWSMRFGATDVLMPDAYDRLKVLLPDLLSEEEKFVPFGKFAGRLTKACPELDGGKLFEMCWQASRGAEVRGNSLSLMLSTALRVLHGSGQIELRHQPDATDVWQLYSAEGHPIGQITHIRLKG